MSQNEQDNAIRTPPTEEDEDQIGLQLVGLPIPEKEDGPPLPHRPGHLMTSGLGKSRYINADHLEVCVF